MLFGFPASPRFFKGALVAYESQFLGPIPNIIVFQYNPEQLSLWGGKTPSVSEALTTVSLPGQP